MERVRTGVEWLDYMIEGGLPKGTWTVLTGEPGTGKSILAMFVAGANLGEMPVVYVTTETSFHDVVEQAKQFKIDLGNAVNLVDILTGKAKEAEDIVVIDLFGLYRQYREMIKEASEEGRRKPSRALSIEVLKGAISKAYEALDIEKGDEALVIIDSMTAFWADKPAMARAYSYELRQSLYRQNVTVLMTSQYAPTTDMSFGFGLEHVADGIIHLWMDDVKQAKAINRWLIVKKMRLTNHIKVAVKFDIQPNGLVLLEPKFEDLKALKPQA